MTLECNGRHDNDSQEGLLKSCITETQKKALDTVVETNLQCRASFVRRATQNMEEEDKIPLKMMISVRKNVWESRERYYTETLGMEMTGTY